MRVTFHMKTPSLDARNLVFFIFLLLRALHIQKLFNVKHITGVKTFNRKFRYFAGVLFAI